MAKFCPHCGTQLGEGIACNCAGAQSERIQQIATQQNVEQQRPAQKNKVIVPCIIGAVIGCIVMGFIVICFLASVGRENQETAAADVQTEEIEIEMPIVEEDVEHSLGNVNQVIDYMEQAEVIMEDYLNFWESKEGEDVADQFKRRHEQATLSIEKLEELQSKVLNEEGFDTNFMAQVNQYFETLLDSTREFGAVANFIGDYLEKITYVGVNFVPDSTNMEFDEYNATIDNWCVKAEEALDNMPNVPISLASEWEQYKKVYDIMKEVNQKRKDTTILSTEGTVLTYDFLEFEAAQHLMKRYTDLESRMYERLLAVSKNQMEFARLQKNKAKDILEEIVSYADMSEESRNSYEFEHNYTNKMNIRYDVVDTIYPSYYNAYSSFAIIKGGCISGNRKMIVEVEIPGFSQAYRETVTVEAAYQTIYVKPPVLTGDLNLSNDKSAQINIVLYEGDGTTVIEAKTFPVTLKSKNAYAWVDNQFIYINDRSGHLPFVTPKDSAMAEVRRNAIDQLKSMTDGAMEGFAGYQKPTYNEYVDTFLYAAAVMRAINEMGVRYDNKSYNESDTDIQPIQLPSEVLESRSGLCLETSLLVASVLEGAGLHTFLVYPKGHAQVAVEVYNTGAYFLIETTALSDDSNYEEYFVKYANELLEAHNYGKETYSGWSQFQNTIGEYTSEGIITYYSPAEWDNHLVEHIKYITECSDAVTFGLTPLTN